MFTAHSSQLTAHSSQLTAHSSPRFVFINYANEQYTYQQKFALWTAKKFGGFTEVKGYYPESIDAKFREAHSEILSFKRGNGLWLWKPYVILDALEHVDKGDYVFYCDSGAFFFDSAMPLIKSMGDCDVWVSGISLIEEQWTKPEVFAQLGITDESIIKSPHIQASFVCARKSEMSCAFIREWLELCTRPELITPLKPGEFRGECLDHREDQSLLSVLCKLRGIKAHRSPAVEPRYYPILHPKSELKKLVKKLLGKKSPIPLWANAQRRKTVYDDEYQPCIYHHRIRRAKSILSVVRQALPGMRPKMAAKFLLKCILALRH